MEVRLVENEQLQRVLGKSTVEVNKFYHLQYKVKDYSIFGNLKNEYWETIATIKDKKEAEKAFNWVLKNNTLAEPLTKILKQAEINEG